MNILIWFTLFVCCYGVPLTTTLQVTQPNQQRTVRPSSSPYATVSTNKQLQTDYRRKNELAMVRRILLKRLPKSNSSNRHGQTMQNGNTNTRNNIRQLLNNLRRKQALLKREQTANRPYTNALDKLRRQPKLFLPTNNRLHNGDIGNIISHRKTSRIGKRPKVKPQKRVNHARTKSTKEILRHVELLRKKKRRRNKWSIENAVKGKVSRTKLNAWYQRRKRKNMKLRSTQQSRRALRGEQQIMNGHTSKLALKKRSNQITKRPTDNTFFLRQNYRTKVYHNIRHTMPVDQMPTTVLPTRQLSNMSKQHEIPNQRNTEIHSNDIANSHIYEHNTLLPLHTKGQSNHHEKVNHHNGMRVHPTSSGVNTVPLEPNTSISGSNSAITTPVVNTDTTLSNSPVSTHVSHISNKNSTEHTRMIPTGVFQKGPDEYHLYLRGIHIVFADKFSFDENTDLRTLHMTASVSETKNSAGNATVEHGDKKHIMNNDIGTEASKSSQPVAKSNGMPVKFEHFEKGKLVGKAIVKSGHLYLMVHLPVNHISSTDKRNTNIRKAIYQSLVTGAYPAGYGNATSSPPPVSHTVDPRDTQNNSASQVSTSTPMFADTSIQVQDKTVSSSGMTSGKTRLEADASFHHLHAHDEHNTESAIHNAHNSHGVSKIDFNTSETELELNKTGNKFMSDSRMDQQATDMIGRSMVHHNRSTGAAHQHTGHVTVTKHRQGNNRTVIKQLSRQLELQIDRTKSPWAGFNFSAVFPAPIATMLRHIDSDDDMYKIYSFIAKATDPFENIKKLVAALADNDTESQEQSFNGISSLLPSTKMNVNSSFNFELEIENIDVLKSSKDTKKQHTIHDKEKLVKLKQDAVVVDGVSYPARTLPSVHSTENSERFKTDGVHNKTRVTIHEDALRTDEQYKAFENNKTTETSTNAHGNGLGNGSGRQYVLATTRDTFLPTQTNIVTLTAHHDSEHATNRIERTTAIPEHASLETSTTCLHAKDETTAAQNIHSHYVRLVTPNHGTLPWSQPSVNHHSGGRSASTPRFYKPTIGVPSKTYSTTININGIRAARKHSESLATPVADESMNHLQQLGDIYFTEQKQPVTNRIQHIITTSTSLANAEGRPEDISQKQSHISSIIKTDQVTRKPSTITPPMLHNNYYYTKATESLKTNPYTKNTMIHNGKVSKSLERPIVTAASQTVSAIYTEAPSRGITESSTVRPGSGNWLTIRNNSPLRPLSIETKPTTPAIGRNKESDESHSLRAFQMTILAAYEQYLKRPRSWIMYTQKPRATVTPNVKATYAKRQGYGITLGSVSTQTSNSQTGDVSEEGTINSEKSRLSPDPKAIKTHKSNSSFTPGFGAIDSRTSHSSVTPGYGTSYTNTFQYSFTQGSGAIATNTTQSSVTPGYGTSYTHKPQSSFTSGVLESDSSKQYPSVTAAVGVSHTEKTHSPLTSITERIDSPKTQASVALGSGTMHTLKNKSAYMKGTSNPRTPQKPVSHSARAIAAHRPTLLSSPGIGTTVSHTTKSSSSHRTVAIDPHKSQSPITSASAVTWSTSSNEPLSTQTAYARAFVSHKPHTTVTPGLEHIHKPHLMVMPDSTVMDSRKLHSVVRTGSSPTLVSGIMNTHRPQYIVTPGSVTINAHRPQLSFTPGSRHSAPHTEPYAVTPDSGASLSHTPLYSVTTVSILINTTKAHTNVIPGSDTMNVQHTLSSLIPGSKQSESHRHTSSDTHTLGSMNSYKSQLAVTHKPESSRTPGSESINSYKLQSSHKPNFSATQASGTSDSHKLHAIVEPGAWARDSRTHSNNKIVKLGPGIIYSRRPHSMVEPGSEVMGKPQFIVTPGALIDNSYKPQLLATTGPENIGSHAPLSSVSPVIRASNAHKLNSSVAMDLGDTGTNKPQSPITPTSDIIESQKQQFPSLTDSSTRDSQNLEYAITHRYRNETKNAYVVTSIQRSDTSDLTPGTARTQLDGKDTGQLSVPNKIDTVQTEQSIQGTGQLSENVRTRNVQGILQTVKISNMRGVSNTAEELGGTSPRTRALAKPKSEIADPGAVLPKTWPPDANRISGLTQAETTNMALSSNIELKSQSRISQRREHSVIAQSAWKHNSELTQGLIRGHRNRVPYRPLLINKVMSTTPFPYRTKVRIRERKLTLNSILPKPTLGTSKPYIPHARPIFWARIMDDDLPYPFPQNMATMAPPVINPPAKAPGGNTWFDDTDGLNAMLILSVDDLLSDQANLHGALILPKDFEQFIH